MDSSKSVAHLFKQRSSAVLLCFVLTITSGAYTWWQLVQIQQGQLFLVQLSGEKPASSYELFDAKRSATQFLIPAVLCVILLGGLALFLIIRWEQLKFTDSKTWKAVAAILIICAIIDLVTTIRFFNQQGVHLEVHPGIRLFGYAYGRTVGPFLGKTVQAIGIIFVSKLMGRAGTLLLTLVALIYLATGIYNSLQA